MVLPTISVPYEDVMTLKADSDKLTAVIELLGTDFPDDTCQLIAIKSVLGIEDTAPVTPPSGNTTP